MQEMHIDAIEISILKYCFIIDLSVKARHHTGGVAWVALWRAFPQTQGISLDLLTFMTSGLFS
jgi:hypothetical protein